MPIHDVGYRNWSGPLTSAMTRWWTISEAGIRTALKSRWIRRAMLASWLPVIYFGVCFFLFEKMMDPNLANMAQRHGVPGVTEGMEILEEQGGADILNQAEREMDRRAFEQLPLLESIPNQEALATAFESEDERVIRNTAWNWLLSTFLRYPQGMMTLLIIGLIVPPLISRDVRSRAFLLYYSRPITRLEYLIGKLAIPGAVLALITMVPAMALYFFGVMLSPNMSVVFDTWDIPIRIVVATAVAVVPTCLIALLFSSLTQESRYAGFAWFTVWGLGAVVWFIIYFSNSGGGQLPFDSNWSLISLYSTIGRVQAWVFGLEPEFSSVLPSMIVLALITVLSALWLNRRVSAPVRN
ncbi:MAG: ABC transporter permease subunit [Pirellulaceae bacterium]